MNYATSCLVVHALFAIMLYICWLLEYMWQSYNLGHDCRRNVVGSPSRGMPVMVICR
jgi:hypothetical protein